MTCAAISRNDVYGEREAARSDAAEPVLERVIVRLACRKYRGGERLAACAKRIVVVHVKMSSAPTIGQLGVRGQPAICQTWKHENVVSEVRHDFPSRRPLGSSRTLRPLGSGF